MSRILPTSTAGRTATSPGSRGPRMRLIDRVQLVIQSLGAWIDVLEGLTDQLERLVKILERLGRVIFRVARLGSAVIFMLGIIVMRLSGVL